MVSRKPRSEAGRLDKVISEARRSQELRETTYREKALNMFPRICARCGREFSGKKLRELTVHHKDHNHENNPPDGSNWELLCIYCHDMEHQRYLEEDVLHEGNESSSTYKPFACLESLLKDRK
ncbi:MAG: YajD family HNH nuclease [Deltaproteobacteria bacterium]|nr:YajD family HNH nuclease [Deltaproteobacteria bacterium]